MKKINFEKITKFIKQKNFIIAFSVFVLTIFSIGISYASFFTIKTNTENQSIQTGTLAVSYGSGSSSITKESLTSMSDEAGMAQSEASYIYIQNTGSLDSTFVLNIGYDMDTFTSRSGYSDTDALTPLDYVMIAVYEYDTATLEDTLVVGPISVTDLAIYSTNDDYRYNRYSILFNTLGSTSTSNSTITYKVKTWLSDKAITKASYTYFYLNTQVVAEVENAKMFYNLSGTLTDGTNALADATISVQNGSFTTTTDSSGAFTLSGLYPGVYNIDITYGGNTYKGNLTVEEGTSESLESLGSTFTGTNVYTVASTYGTTVSKILDINGISTYSSEVSLSSGSLYPTYKFIGSSSEDISGISIVLDTTNITYTMSM